MKKDKGFEICFSNLSYRRKFIRILWTSPFILLVVLLDSIYFKSTIITVALLILVVLVTLIQAIYLYKKWKNGGDINNTK